MQRTAYNPVTHQPFKNRRPVVCNHRIEFNDDTFRLTTLVVHQGSRNRSAPYVTHPRLPTERDSLRISFEIRSRSFSRSISRNAFDRTGDSEQGHYYIYRKYESGWLCYNDETVSSISELPSGIDLCVRMAMYIKVFDRRKISTFDALRKLPTRKVYRTYLEVIVGLISYVSPTAQVPRSASTPPRDDNAVPVPVASSVLSDVATHAVAEVHVPDARTRPLRLSERLSDVYRKRARSP